MDGAVSSSGEVTMNSKLGGCFRRVGSHGLFAAGLAWAAAAGCGGDSNKHGISVVGAAGQGGGAAGEQSASARAGHTADHASAGGGNDSEAGAPADGGRSNQGGTDTEGSSGGRGATASGGGARASGGSETTEGGSTADDAGGTEGGGRGAGGDANSGGRTSTGGNAGKGGHTSTGGEATGGRAAGGHTASGGNGTTAGTPSTGGDEAVGGDDSAGGTSDAAGAGGAPDGGTGGSLPELCAVGTAIESCVDPRRTCEGGVCRDDPAPERCFDGEQNGLETDVDCGGRFCSPCVVGHACLEDSDCLSLTCSAQQCAAAEPSCVADENFETGDFSRFPYTFGGNPETAPAWTVQSGASECHGGSYCMRTSAYQEGGETSSVSLALSVRQDSTISFFVRTETEPDEYIFRFYVDGVLQTQLSGEHDWQELSFDVEASGPGGPKRVFTWEYQHSTFVPDHAPYNSVWVDDIDLPDWNSPPSVPVLLAPGNGARMTMSPTFHWRSTDRDFDPITYEVVYSTDPSFATETVSTGETVALSWTPLPALAAATYFWRARAKDDSDYVWTDWSEPSSVTVVEQDDYPVRWRQSTGDEFRLNELVGVAVDSNQVRVSDAPYEQTVSSTVTDYLEASLTFQDLPPVRADAAMTVSVTATADVFVRWYDWSRGSCYNRECGETYSVMLSVSADDYHSSIANDQLNCQYVTFTDSFSVESADTLINDDGTLVLTIQGQDPGCGTEYLLLEDSEIAATVSYPAVDQGTMTSVPIYFDDFGGANNWEKLVFGATAGTTLQVLDLDGELIPDVAIPGNSGGLPPGTVHLFWLDAAEYPAIRLRAHLVANSTLSFWEVYANDGYRWNLGHDGDKEGWQALDDGATPTVSVADGVLDFASTASGTNPRLEYRFTQSVAATRFQQAVLRARTSNDSADDTVTFYWESNYGLFDPARSFSVVDFLQTPQDVAFDLTQPTVSPSQPWRGDISAIRLDPVSHFFDAGGNPSDGWVEVEEIWLR
jgi:hypothetical protein